MFCCLHWPSSTWVPWLLMLNLFHIHLFSLHLAYSPMTCALLLTVVIRTGIQAGKAILVNPKRRKLKFPMWSLLPLESVLIGILMAGGLSSGPAFATRAGSLSRSPIILRSLQTKWMAVGWFKFVPVSAWVLGARGSSLNAYGGHWWLCHPTHFGGWTTAWYTTYGQEMVMPFVHVEERADYEFCLTHMLLRMQRSMVSGDDSQSIFL